MQKIDIENDILISYTYFGSKTKLQFAKGQIMTKAIFFDLFFTLIIPVYDKENNEFNILNLSMQEWEKYAEADSLYRERALGFVKSEMEIIDKIVVNLPFEVNDIQKESILAARENRMKRALQNIPNDIVDVLTKLKSQNIKIGLISNADIIDCKYWNKSILFPFLMTQYFPVMLGF